MILGFAFMSFDPRLLTSWLRCTRSRAVLVFDGKSLVCVDPQVRLQYAIRDGIPSLLAEEAATLSPAEWGMVMQRHGRDFTSGALLDTPPSPAPTMTGATHASP